MVQLRQRRELIAQATFILLVIIIPIFVGVSWLEHRRNDEVEEIVAERRALLIAGCERGNDLRIRVNQLLRDPAHNGQGYNLLPILDCPKEIPR